MTDDLASIPRLPRQDSYVLSTVQRGLWSLVQASQDLSNDNASRIVKLAGPLDLGRLRQALDLLVARYGLEVAAMQCTTRDAMLSTGLGSCPLVLGECVQGRLGDQRHFLITSPVNAFSWAEFTPELSLRDVVVDPPGRTKAQKAVKSYLSGARHPCGGRLKVFTPMQPGLGFGTSTADLTASVRAAAAAWGEVVPPADISRIAIGLEPTDGSMYRGSVAYNHRRGLLLEALGNLPEFYALVVCGEGEVDTEAFDARRKDFCYSRKDEALLRTAWDMVRYAVRHQDLAVLGSASTISARINEQLLVKPYFREMHEFMEQAGLSGLIAGHSGTLLAFLLDPHEPGFDKKLERTREFADSLRPRLWLETSNNQLPQEMRWSTGQIAGAAAVAAADHAVAWAAELAAHWPELERAQRGSRRYRP
jgi:uncharacterized protein involved in propanediol utilization